MKVFIWAIFILILVFALVITNTVVLRVILNKIIDRVKSIEIIDTDDACEDFKLLYEDFERYERFINLTVSHSDLTNIDDAFAEIIGAGLCDDVDGMVNAKSRLINSLEHLRRLSGMNIDSIF